MSEKNTPCILPWINFSTNPFGRSRPCGHSVKKSEKSGRGDSVKAQFNSPLFKEVRQDFLNGKWPENCRLCEYVESHTPGLSKKSMDDFFYNQHKDLLGQTHADGSVDYFPKQIDIRISAQCNLKCIHCGTGNSTKWSEDTELLGRYPNTEKVKKRHLVKSLDSALWKDVLANLDGIEKFNFQGGEPFADRRHNSFLDSLSNSARAHELELHYVSNGTLVNAEVVEKLLKFRHVTLNISVDASDDVLRFYRFPIDVAKWEERLRVIESYACKKLDLGFQWSCSGISLFYLDRSIDHFTKQFPKFTFKFCNFVENPAQMSAQNLPVKTKTEISRRLGPYAKVQPQISFYLDHMWAKDLWPQSGEVLLNYLADLSRIRGLDWRESMPEFSDSVLSHSEL